MSHFETASSRRVLLAETDLRSRAALAATLRQARLEVVEVPNGFAAFRSYMRLLGEVDLVVAPTQMEEYDGLALARGLATLAPALPVLLLGREPGTSEPRPGNVRFLARQVEPSELLSEARLALAC